MKTLGMFITLSFLVSETGLGKDLQDLTLSNDTTFQGIPSTRKLFRPVLPPTQYAARKQLK